MTLTISRNGLRAQRSRSAELDSIRIVRYQRTHAVRLMTVSRRFVEIMHQESVVKLYRVFL
jgi:hypothetical protein